MVFQKESESGEMGAAGDGVFLEVYNTLLYKLS